MIHIFIGTKAQLIKMAPVMRELQSRGIEYNYVSSGQHNDTIDELIECFHIKAPDQVLYSGRDVTGILQMLTWGIRIVLLGFFRRKQIWRGDANGVILNHGDTVSTLLGSIIGRMAKLKTAHVESGLRSFDLLHPFPEELTRLLVFRLAEIYFAPGAWAIENLRKYRGEKIDTAHNTLLDSLRVAVDHFDRCSVEMPDCDYAVATIHRFENIFNEARLTWVVDEILKISEYIRIIFILHVPTRKNLEKHGLLTRLESAANVELRGRYDYLNFIKLVDGSEFVISDGGSNQEECSYLGKPCLLFRDTTERRDGLGQNVVLSHYDHKIVTDFVANYKNLQVASSIVESQPSKLIVDALEQYYPLTTG